MDQDSKQKRKDTREKTREKRKNQLCKVFELKIDYSHLNKEEKERLFMMFLEAKKLYNYIISLKGIGEERFDPIFKYDTKTNPIKIKNKDRTFSDFWLKFLPAKCRQDVRNQITKAIQANSSKKKKQKEKGKKEKIGDVGFISKFPPIELSQYQNTHKIVSDNKIRITGIKRPILVYGLEQIPEECEIANGKVCRRDSGYYIMLTTYQNKKPEDRTKDELIAIDFNKTQSVVTSEGDVYKIHIPETEKYKKLQRKLGKQKKGSKNRDETKKKLRIESAHVSSCKEDQANKIYHHLCKNKTIVIQDDNFSSWKDGSNGKSVQDNILGRVKSKLKRGANGKLVVIDRWFPSTKLCVCGKINEIPLWQRTYRCECGYVEERDFKSAKILKTYGSWLLKQGKIPMDRRELTTVETTKELLSEFKSWLSMNQEAKMVLAI